MGGWVSFLTYHLATFFIDISMNRARNGEANHPHHEDEELPAHSVQGGEEHKVERGTEDVPVHLLPATVVGRGGWVGGWVGLVFVSSPSLRLDG